jgi:hypothetical protein
MEVKDGPIEPEFPITLGGKEYKLAYPLPAIWALEDISGFDILSGDITLEFWNKTKTSRRTKFVAQLCWAGLQPNYPGLKFSDVAALISLKNFAYVEAIVSRSFTAWMNSEKKEETDRPTQGNG